MSMLEDLGARLRAAAADLPADAIAVAGERLRLATDLLMWVRRSSADPMGVPSLASATEHLEQAGYAMRVGQDHIGDYLAALGLGQQPGPADGPAPREPVPEEVRPPEPETGESATALGRWWESRVNHLAEHAEPDAEGSAAKDGDSPGDASRDRRRAGRPAPERDDGFAARDSTELLRQAAQRAAAGDRDGLRSTLARVEAPVGLGMSALTPPLLRQFAIELLGHEPGPDDLPRLRSETAHRVRDLMPRMPDGVVTTLLARVCRAPDQKSSGGNHPADAAVAGAIITGVLAQRAGHDPGSLRPGEAPPQQPAVGQARQPSAPPAGGNDRPDSHG